MAALRTLAAAWAGAALAGRARAVSLHVDKPGKAGDILLDFFFEAPLPRWEEIVLPRFDNQVDKPGSLETDISDKAFGEGIVLPRFDSQVDKPGSLETDISDKAFGKDFVLPRFDNQVDKPGNLETDISDKAFGEDIVLPRFDSQVDKPGNLETDISDNTFGEKSELPRLDSQVDACSLKQQDDKWEDETKYFECLRQTARKRVSFKDTTAIMSWPTALVSYTTAPETLLNTLQEFKKKVAWPGGPTVDVVFQKFKEYHCPVWIAGGFVRDHFADQPHKDVDIAVLCGGNIVQPVLRALGSPSTDSGHFIFSEGLFEGFQVTLFTLEKPPEYSATMLFLSVAHGMVVDPMGCGIEDAKAKTLRPAMLEYYQVAGRWAQWMEGDLLGAEDETTKMRLKRYSKMIGREWQPFNHAFGEFMKAEEGRAGGNSATRD